MVITIKYCFFNNLIDMISLYCKHKKQLMRAIGWSLTAKVTVFAICDSQIQVLSKASLPETRFIVAITQRSIRSMLVILNGDSHAVQYSSQNWQHTLKTDTNTVNKITDKHGQLTVSILSFLDLHLFCWHSMRGF